MNISKTSFIVLILLIIVIVGAVEWFIYDKIKLPIKVDKVVTSFEECAAAGYPIMESYPEQCATPDGQTFVREIPVNDKSDKIVVDNLTEGAKISSPLTIEGRARGTWYFEASFPIALEDSTGKEIAVAIAQAQSEWMTEDFVPFSTTLTFATTSGTGTLVFKKDNPSGLPEHEDSLRIPIIFK